MPDKVHGSKALVNLIVLYVLSYRWVHFSRAVLYCQPHQKLFAYSLKAEEAVQPLTDTTLWKHAWEFAFVRMYSASSSSVMHRVGVHVGMHLESWHLQPLGPLCCIDHCITDVTDVPADTSLTLSKEHARHDTLPTVCLPSLFYSLLTSYANSVGEHIQ